MYKILSKKVLNETVIEMEVHAPFVARKCLAGQFLMVMVKEDGERIPLTIADYSRERESVTIIFQVVGYTTTLMSELSEGDKLYAVTGPMGVPTHINGKLKRVLGIGGGVGVAPLYPQIKAFKEAGVHVDTILGGRNKDYVIMQDRFTDASDNLYVCTDDGSAGIKGFVTTQLQKLVDEGNEYDEVIAIGPLVMMRAVVEITKKLGIKTSVSLNPIMIDGTGMCGGCRLTYDGKTKFACVDGPDFDGFLVDFDELISRGKKYKKQEEKHMCMLDRGGN